MRWNTLAEDTPRALALADILMGAATADSKLILEERIIVGAMLMKVLGVSELPPEVEAHLHDFDPETLNLVDACARLGLDSDKEKMSLIKVVADIVKADDKIERSEKGFVLRLAKAIGISAADVKTIMG